jgi:hypothetical protein
LLNHFFVYVKLYFCTFRETIFPPFLISNSIHLLCRVVTFSQSPFVIDPTHAAAATATDLPEIPGEREEGGKQCGAKANGNREEKDNLSTKQAKENLLRSQSIDRAAQIPRNNDKSS